MFAALRNFAQSLLGRGEATITVPSFDGALRPNQALERAETISECEAPEDLATDGAHLFLADGPRLVRVEADKTTVVREFGQNITALACWPDGGFAVALAGREVRSYADPTAERPRATISSGLRSINALATIGAEAQLATEGSATRDVDQWAWDLMERGHSGRVLRLDFATGAVAELARDLHYAFGVGAIDGAALVSESWRHRLVAVSPTGANRVVLSHLPVYPSRISPAADGGWWLTAFIARTLLVEFVLREPAYRKRMMAEVDPEHWIVPRLSSGKSFKEPMQGAHVKTMGIVKPWAPPRSYGLVIRLDAAGRPLYSLHSRVDGLNHGIVAAVEHGGFLYLVAKGPRRLLRLPIEGLAEEFSA